MTLTLLRFLHTSQLTLRPGLEMFCEMQHDPQPRYSSPLHGLVLGQLALQCVLSAVQLSGLLSAEISNHQFPCWWYNIGCA